MGIYSEYLRILQKELEIAPILHQDLFFLNDPAYFCSSARRILEVAKNSAVLRCGAKMGHLTRNDIAFESDGAHTNLVREIVDMALDFLYGWGNDPPNYSRYEISRAALWHDLPENETGDKPDNGTRDESTKRAHDRAYFNDYANLHPQEHSIHCLYVLRLLEEMEDKSTEEGRILYLADKIAAVIAMLAYDSLAEGELTSCPRAWPNDPCISEINLAEMKICQEQADGSFLLSELWTNDFLFARELNKYDDYGFFTALLVMSTLLVHGKWHNWREKHYLP